MSEIFCGIDPSLTSTGIVLIQGDKVLSETSIAFPEKPNYEHFKDMNNFFSLFWERNVNAIGLESYAFAAQGNTLTRLVELGTMIRYVASEHIVPTYILAPQNIKKFVANKTFKKDETRLAVYKQWGYENKSSDLVDAYAIARYTQAIYNNLKGVAQELKGHQVEAINSWKKNKNGLFV